MADVVSYTQAGVDALVAGLIASISIDGGGNITALTQDGTSVAIGTVLTSMPFATETVNGILSISSATDVSTGTEDNSAVTPLKLKTVTNALSATDATKQALPQLFGGSSYAAATGATIYIGGTPSGTIANGSVWFDTT